MAKNNKIEDFEMETADEGTIDTSASNEDKSSEPVILENREIYPTGFRNIDTNIGFNVYDDDDNFIKTNRGILSGSWITYTGWSHSGKSTLAVQHASNMMRPFVNENNPDTRVKLHMIQVENGVHAERFRALTGWSYNQIKRHVVWHTITSIEALQGLINSIIKDREDKNYKLDRRIGSQGVTVDIYPPVYIIIDAISELVSETVLDVDEDVTNTLYMRQNLMLDQFIKKNKLKFVKYNINILAIGHLANKTNIGGNPMAKPVRELNGLPADAKLNGGKAIMYASDLVILIDKIAARDAKAVEAKGGRMLDATSIREAKMIKNRQALDNILFYLVFDQKGRFDALSSFIYECQQLKILESAGAIKKIRGTEHKCRSQDLIDNILTNEEFRTALFQEYDNEKSSILESTRNTKEERERINSIFDIMSL